MLRYRLFLAWNTQAQQHYQQFRHFLLNHGYKHILEFENSGILEINKRSEFAGANEEQQNKRK